MVSTRLLYGSLYSKQEERNTLRTLFTTDGGIAWLNRFLL